MKKAILIAAASILLIAPLSCKRYESVEGDPLETKIHTLDNGLKIFMSVNKETPRIQTYIAVKVGGKNDPSETTGLAHYFEHLMFKGTEQFGTSDYAAEKPLLDEIEQLFETYRKTEDEAERAAIYHRIDSISYEASKISIPNEYDKLMAVIGAEGTNAWTSADETVYTEDIPSNQIDNWARIQSDRFRNIVIRGFHTELETIYEEKNMSLTQDSRKLWEALDNGLYPHHPYGKQTVLGTQEHLKNPSITNVKKYHDQYYVPNNIAICLSGDFDPDEMVKTIEKYFGDWEPNPNIPVLQFEQEQPLTEPLVKEVYGLESEMIALGWRLPKAADIRNTAIAEIAGNILYNGQAGLMDIDLMQQQKVLSAQAASSIQPDCSEFIALGMPKEGQTLDELRALLLEETAKLRSGDFDESLIEATINNIKLRKMYQLESNESRAQMYINAFINGIDWSVAAKELEVLESVTKEDVIAWANEFIGAENYVAVYKRQGEDTSVQKISAPKITPIESNRNLQSAFLTEIQNSVVKPIEPVFVDFEKDMSKFDLAGNTGVLYKQNNNNDIFQLDFVFNEGAADDPALNVAPDYLSYLGTPTMSAEQIKARMYALACDFGISSGAYRTTVSLSGLSENMEEALGIVEDLIFNAIPDEDILEQGKSDILKSRESSMKAQRSCFSALQRYLIYGPEYIRSTVIPNKGISALSSEDLLTKISGLYDNGHEILYYGPMAEDELKSVLERSHKLNPDGKAIAESHAATLLTPSNQVTLSQYDAKQLYYFQYSNRGESFKPEAHAISELYNEYFGGGMNAIVFQEMREARGLAYSASAYLAEPSFTDSPYYFQAFIATQNDKMQTAVEAFDEIINEMPESEAAFSVAKDALTSRLRTNRTIGMDVLRSYVACRRLGLEKPLDEQMFNEIQSMTLKDVKAFQEEWVKGRSYNFAILGDIKDLDMDYLKTLGPVKVVSTNEIFGY